VTAPVPALRTVVIAAAVDLVFVLVFVLIGRGSHEEGFSILGSLNTAWPFMAGLTIGWFVTRAWRVPRGVSHPGLAIWASTAVIGVALRAISGQGVAVSFVIVTAIVLAVFLLGWRLIVALVARRSLARG
jgi:hypothetical protein